MNDNSYGLLCALLMGVGQMCMFTGYDTQSFIVEPVLHSVHDRSPGTIDAHAGYYGAAVRCVVYTFANLIAPWFLGIFGSKLTLVLGSATYTLYLMSFLYVHYIPFYLTSAVMGLGFSLYYTGNGGYVTEHSTRNTIERNSALIWGVGTNCMVVGGIVLLFTISPPPTMTADFSSSSDVFNNKMNQSVAYDEDGTVRSYREYTDFEIRLMFGAFALVAFASNVIFALIPSRPVKNSLAEMGGKGGERVGFVEQLKKMRAAMADIKMLKMAPSFCLVGSTTSFWILVYPTALIFTKKLSGFVYLPAYYSIILGTGDVIMGFLISYLSKRIPNFGQKPTAVIGSVLFFIALILALLCTPAWSTNTPNDDPTLLLEPSMTLALIIAFLFGLADNCFNTSRTVLAALVLPGKRSQVFSISKFYQSLTEGTIMFISPLLSIPMYFVILAINLILSLYFFFSVADENRHYERKITLATQQAVAASVNDAPIRSILENSEKIHPAI